MVHAGSGAPESVSTKSPSRAGTPRAVISCHPRHPLTTVARVSRWLQTHRRRVDTRPWQRAATCWTQAILVLRWLKDGTDIDLLARDAKVSQATGYRYLHEAIGVIAAQPPTCPRYWPTDTPPDGHACAWTAPRSAPPAHRRNDAGHDLWYSGKHKRHGGNIQVVTDPSGFRSGSPRSNPAPPTT